MCKQQTKKLNKTTTTKNINICHTCLTYKPFIQLKSFVFYTIRFDSIWLYFANNYLSISNTTIFVVFFSWILERKRQHTGCILFVFFCFFYYMLHINRSFWWLCVSVSLFLKETEIHQKIYTHFSMAAIIFQLIHIY